MAKKPKRLEIYFKPLQTSCTIEVVGTVPARQIYQADKAEYTPDYTLTPLVLFPRCNAINLDSDTVIDNINPTLTNMKWHQIVGGVESQIIASTPGYEITHVGARKGQLRISRNITTSQPVTLKFSANYTDERTGQVYKFQMNAIVIAVDGTAAIPTITLDSPSTATFNPIRESPATQVITARVFAGDKEVTGKCRFFWYKVNPSTGAHETPDDKDLEFVSAAGNILTIDRSYIEEATYICKASYDPDGNPADTPLPYLTVSTTIRRRLAAFECDWEGVPTVVADDTAAVYPRPIVEDTFGVIPNVEDGELKFSWLVKRSPGAPYTMISNEIEPEIKFSDRMMIQLEVEDRGALVPLVDENGNTIYDGDKIVTTRRNG